MIFGSHFGSQFLSHFDLILGSVLGLVLGVLFGTLLGLCSRPEAAQARARRGPEASRRGDFAAIYDGFGMSPLLLLSGLLVPSWRPLGANLAPQGRLLDPKRVQKWVPKVIQNGVQKRNPKSCLARVGTQPEGSPLLCRVGGVGGYLWLAQQAVLAT